MNKDSRMTGGRVPVNKIIPFSSVDGPGNRTAVFLQGCNFDCRYCHNPETRAVCINCGQCVSSCPAGALSIIEGKVCFNPAKCKSCDTCIHICGHNASPRIRFMNAEEVMEEIRKNVPFIRGVTVSGGECTFYPEFLRELGNCVKKEKLGFLLDSNGSYDFSEDPAGLMSVIDGVMLDVKSWTREDHERVTGCDNAMVLRNLETLGEAGKLFEVRTVVVPELFDAEETVRETARRVGRYRERARKNTEGEVRDIRYKIIKYRPMGVREQYRGMTSPENAFLEHLKKIALNEGVEDVVLI